MEADAPLPPLRDWDDAYANMAHIAGSEALPALWTERAAAYRAGGVPIETDIAYGPHPRERLDLVWPERTPEGLVVFVHGGYWMKLDKSFWTDLAEGARARGWAVALPSYTLAPEAGIGSITRQIARAVEVAAERAAGPVRLAGHSAGGHLAARMVCTDAVLGAATFARVAGVLSISGLHDLRPLRQTAMNATLRLDEAQALAESPALMRPRGDIPFTAWVGGGERPEFIRQARLLAMMWEGLDTRVRAVVDGAHHHFSVIDGLGDPASPITAALLGEDWPQSLPRSFAFRRHAQTS